MLGLMLPRSYFRRVVLAGMYAMPKRSTPPIEDLSLGGLVTNRALSMMDQAYSSEQATFFFLHYMDPHEPYVAPEGYHGSRPGPDPLQRYLEEVEFIDDCIEKIVVRSRESGRPFVVLFTSDHGEHLGEHGFTGHANTLYNPTIHVPFILYGDGIPTDLKIDDVGLEDVAPTLLARCGLPAEEMYGRNVLDPNVEAAGTFFARDENYYAAVVGEYKWISSRGWKPGQGPDGEWFRWKEDPGENNPVEVDEESWIKILEAFEQVPATVEAVYDSDEAARQMAVMEALGYVEAKR